MEALEKDISNKDETFIAKVSLVGDFRVGKTSLLVRYCDRKFTSPNTTVIGSTFKTKAIPFDGDVLKLAIWDTAGSERFQYVPPIYFKGALGVVFVYAVNDRKSFENIKSWMQNPCFDLSACFFLVGNKCDNEATRQVPSEEGQKFAETHQMEFFETSARDDINVDQMFDSLAQKIYHILKSDPSTVKRTKGIIGLESKPSGKPVCEDSCKGC